MQREEKSERSRRAILDAALYLFSHHGYGATTMRDIAQRARVSTGAVYHHFEDKETLFRTLLDEYFALTASTAYPFTRVSRGAEVFPDNVEQLGFAARDSVRLYRQYLALTYVDVIEFGGTHTHKFYANIARNLQQHLSESGQLETIGSKLRPGVSPVSAMLLTAWLYFNYFTTEILFGVESPFGKNSNEIVAEVADIIRHGVCAEKPQ